MTECGFEFPVPIDDTGDGVFLAEDKAMLFMRYIRKHVESINKSMSESSTVPQGFTHPLFPNLLFVDSVTPEFKQQLDNLSPEQREMIEDIGRKALATGKAVFSTGPR